VRQGCISAFQKWNTIRTKVIACATLVIQWSLEYCLSKVLILFIMYISFLFLYILESIRLYIKTLPSNTNNLFTINPAAVSTVRALWWAGKKRTSYGLIRVCFGVNVPWRRTKIQGLQSVGFAVVEISLCIWFVNLQSYVINFYRTSSNTRWENPDLLKYFDLVSKEVSEEDIIVIR